jgi:protoporphyrinogen oxidase
VESHAIVIAHRGDAHRVHRSSSGANIEMPQDARNSTRKISYSTSTATSDTNDARIMTDVTSRALVIGGGFSGVAAATALRAQKCDVTLLEQHDVLGGRARSTMIDSRPIDVGAQLIASTFGRATRLLARAPLEATRGRDLYVSEGKRMPVHFGSISSMLRFGALSLVDKIRLGATVLPLLARHSAALDVEADHDLAELDAMTARAYIEDSAGARAADAVVEPALNAFYGMRGGETSLAFFLTLGRYGSDAELLAPRGGWSGALERVAADVRVEYGARVNAIAVTASGVVARDASGREWAGDGAIIATSADVARPLLGGLPAALTLAEWLGTVETRRTWTVLLALRRGVHSDAFGVLADPREATMVSACAIPSGRWSVALDAPPVVLAWPTPAAVDELGHHPAHEIVAAMMPEIARLVPEVSHNVERARVVRFDEGTPLARPGFLAHRAEGRVLAEALDLPIALAGDYLTMPLVEGAVLSGERAAEQLVRRLSHL